MKKAVICAVCLLSLAMGLLGCGKAPAQKDTIEIDAAAFLLYNQQNGMFSIDRAAWEAAASGCSRSLAEQLSESFELKVSEDLTSLTLLYDQMLALEAGITLVNTQIVFSKEPPDAYVSPVEQAPEVL